MGKEPESGYLHPLLMVRAEFRKILLEMGFTEMPTNQFVESSFWNFDALFQPQSHPARDAQDTFFISDPASTLTVPEDYLQDVAKIHSEGGFGSFGYGYQWDRREAMKNILRTHTTAVSTKELYKAAKNPEGFKPMKCFSIDRVFRNETMDATHLAEFHQVELFVADRNLNLGHLIGMINDFFAKIGITDIRFKPAFNLPPGSEPLDGDRKQRNVPPGDAATDGTAGGCAMHRVRIVAGEVRERRESEAQTDDDQVSLQEYS